MILMNAVDPREIKKLYKRFTRLDKAGTGRITSDDLLSIPELAMNPLAPRVIGIFNVKKEDQISFKQFVQTLSVFSPRASADEKLKCMHPMSLRTNGSVTFQVYDVKGDGFIDREELTQVLKMMVGNHLTETQLETIVEKTMIEADKDGDDRLSFKEFGAVSSSLFHIDIVKVMSSTSDIQKMSISF